MSLRRIIEWSSRRWWTWICMEWNMSRWGRGWARATGYGSANVRGTLISSQALSENLWFYIRWHISHTQSSNMRSAPAAVTIVTSHIPPMISFVVLNTPAWFSMTVMWGFCVIPASYNRGHSATTYPILSTFPKSDSQRCFSHFGLDRKWCINDRAQWSEDGANDIEAGLGRLC